MVFLILLFLFITGLSTFHWAIAAAEFKTMSVAVDVILWLFIFVLLYLFYDNERSK